MNRNKPKSLQHRWQFQTGVAFIVVPFLILWAGTTWFFKKAMAEGGTEAPRAEQFVETGFTVAYWILPASIIGVLFIVLAVRRHLTERSAG